MKPLFILLFVFLSLSACTSSNWYHGMKASEQVQCLNVPQSEYDECMKNSNESYEEYKQKREELEK